MPNVYRYLDRARARRHLQSDYALAKELRVTRGAINHFRQGRSLPDEKTMLVLAKLAGVRPALALADLLRMRAQRSNNADLVAVYNEVIAALGPTDDEYFENTESVRERQNAA